MSIKEEHIQKLAMSVTERKTSPRRRKVTIGLCNATSCKIFRPAVFPARGECSKLGLHSRWRLKMMKDNCERKGLPLPDEDTARSEYLRMETPTHNPVLSRPSTHTFLQKTLWLKQSVSEFIGNHITGPKDSR